MKLPPHQQAELRLCGGFGGQAAPVTAAKACGKPPLGKPIAPARSNFRPKSPAKKVSENRKTV